MACKAETLRHSGLLKDKKYQLRDIADSLNEDEQAPYQAFSSKDFLNNGVWKSLETDVQQLAVQVAEIALKATISYEARGFVIDQLLSSGRDKSFAGISLKILGIVSEQLQLQLNELTFDRHLIKDLGIDGLDLLELVMALEEEFDMEIPRSVES